MKPGTGVFGKLTDLYRRMGEAYATTAKAAGLSCDDCPHNCCTSYFQHHTYIEWIYLHKGLNALPEQRRKEYASRAEAYLAEAEIETERQKQEKLLVSKGIVQKVDKYIAVDDRIGIKLKLENKAFKVEKYEHTYPHCWRTDKPILYYPLDSWFIRTTAVKDRLVELN